MTSILSLQKKNLDFFVLFLLTNKVSWERIPRQASARLFFLIFFFF